MSIQAGQDGVVNAEVQEQVEEEVYIVLTAASTYRLESTRIRVLRRCNKYNSYEYTAPKHSIPRHGFTTISYLEFVLLCEIASSHELKTRRISARTSSNLADTGSC